MRLIKFIIVWLILMFSVCCFGASITLTKGQIGEQDFNRYDGVTKTFTRATSTGGIMTLTKVGPEVDALMSYGGGANYNSTTINSAITAIGSGGAVLTLRPGTWTMNANITVPANIVLKVPKGASIVTTGFTGSAVLVDAGAYQIFTGTGTFTVSGKPQDQAWWGNAQRTDVTGLKTGAIQLTASPSSGYVLVSDSTGVGSWTSLTASGMIPVGAGCLWFNETVPSGWLEADGSSLLRASYPALYAAYGTLYGTADVLHFNIPDLRGYFPRGWAHGQTTDPDKASRTAPSTPGATITAGDHVGTVQTFDVESHAHLENFWNSSTGGGGTGATANTSAGSNMMTSNINSQGLENKTGGSRVETRPLNMNVIYIIRAQ